MTNEEEQPKKNKFQIKKQTKFCTDSKQQGLSGFLVFASKIATILRLKGATAHCAGNKNTFWLSFKRNLVLAFSHFAILRC